jgi:uncharacterized protein YhbP (UPF0306 family)
MDEELRARILGILRKHRLMTIATLRPDGWPQATTVGYVSRDMTLFFLCDRQSQKAHNLDRDNRVSLTINRDSPNLMAIEGLSMAARAEPLHSRMEMMGVLNMLAQEYPESAGLPPPDLDAIRIYRLTPVIISVIDYSKGFGHTDLVHCQEVMASAQT